MWFPFSDGTVTAPVEDRPGCWRRPAVVAAGPASLPTSRRVSSIGPYIRHASHDGCVDLRDPLRRRAPRQIHRPHRLRLPPAHQFRMPRARCDQRYRRVAAAAAHRRRSALRRQDDGPPTLQAQQPNPEGRSRWRSRRTPALPPVDGRCAHIPAPQRAVRDRDPCGLSVETRLDPYADWRRRLTSVGARPARSPPAALDGTTCAQSHQPRCEVPLGTTRPAHPASKIGPVRRIPRSSGTYAPPS